MLPFFVGSGTKHVACFQPHAIQEIAEHGETVMTRKPRHIGRLFRNVSGYLFPFRVIIHAGTVAKQAASVGRKVGAFAT